MTITQLIKKYCEDNREVHMSDLEKIVYLDFDDLMGKLPEWEEQYEKEIKDAYNIGQVNAENYCTRESDENPNADDYFNQLKADHV